jgi:hypothetical protein
MQAQVMMKGTAGSLKYIASENILGNGCFFSGGVYSFGVLLWELLSSLDIPFGNMSSHEYQVEVAVEGYLPNIRRVGAAVTKSVKVLIQDCWDEDRSVRPTFSQVRKKKNRPPGQQQQQRRRPLSIFRLSGFRTTTTTSDPIEVGLVHESGYIISCSYTRNADIHIRWKLIIAGREYMMDHLPTVLDWPKRAS